MKALKLIPFWIFCAVSSVAFSQPFIFEYQQCYGGSGGDGALDMDRLADSTCIILAITGSEDGDISFNHGECDFWLVNVDNYGNLLWGKTYGGSDVDSPQNIALTTDGGYILYGNTQSTDGDVSGNHGGFDLWVVKTDNQSNIIWQRCLGSSVNELKGQMCVDDIGNIYVIGSSHGVDGDISNNNGLIDFWIAKLSQDGELLSEKSLGGEGYDLGHCISLTTDGGCIVGGFTMSNYGDVDCDNPTYNQGDIWIVELDSLFNIQWKKCYGGSFHESATDIKVLDDGSYIIAGITNSDDGDVSGFHGVAGSDYNDIWVIKIDSIGNIEWQRCLGGTKNEGIPELTLTEDGEYIINGCTQSHDGDVTGNNSIGTASDIWLLKLNVDGDLLWQQCFGSRSSEASASVNIISSIELIIAGGASHPSGNVYCDLFHPGPPGDGDLWIFQIVDTVLVKLPENEMDSFNISVFPNPAQSFITFELPKQYEKSMLEIIDVYGKVLIKTKLNNPKEVIDVQTIKPGVYVYTLKAAGFSKWGKIVINK